MNNKVRIIDLNNQIYENKITLKIYNIIFKKLELSFEIYPLENNLIAVYSIHLLKYLSSIFLKKNEIITNNLLSDFKSVNLNSFPYLSYEEITNNKIIDNKKYGIYQKNTFKQKIKSIMYKYKSFSHNDISSSLNALSINDFKYLNKNLNVNFISFINNFFYEDIKDQINILEEIIEEVYDSIEMPLNKNSVFKLFNNHIKINVSEGKDKYKLVSDFTLLTSGSDTINRHLAAKSLKYKKKIIILDHAHYTGYTDDVIFGLGEQLYSDYFIGFGDFYSFNKKNYDFSKNYKCKILNSSSSKINEIKKLTKHKKNNISNVENFYYIPTSLRGPSYRYGPFMDISDKTYLDWQNVLKKIFGSKIIIKHHPKDQFRTIYKKYHKDTRSSEENISNIIYNKSNICFIFDTIGTAFAEVSATNFPIIFFDLHQRNIPEFIKLHIKKRCLYIDLNKYKYISLDDIYDQISNFKFDFSSLDKFSISNDNLNNNQIKVLNNYFEKIR